MAIIGGKKKEDGSGDDRPLYQKIPGTKEDRERTAEWAKKDAEHEAWKEQHGVGQESDDSEESDEE